jgi:hypothetical protein
MLEKLDLLKTLVYQNYECLSNIINNSAFLQNCFINLFYGFVKDFERALNLDSHIIFSFEIGACDQFCMYFSCGIIP